MAYSIAKTAAKVGVAGGTVYWSIQQGIWGPPQEGAEAGKRLTKTFAPAASDIVQKIPSVEKINDSAKKNWNSGMKTVFTAVSKVPETAIEYKNRAKSAASSLVEKD